MRREAFKFWDLVRLILETLRYIVSIETALPALCVGNKLSTVWVLALSGGWFNMKIPSYQYRKSHCGDKTVVRSSYLHNGISYTGKMTSLYWVRAQIARLTTNHIHWCTNHDGNKNTRWWTFVHFLMITPLQNSLLAPRKISRKHIVDC